MKRLALEANAMQANVFLHVARAAVVVWFAWTGDV
jgi:hypothetical protein